MSKPVTVTISHDLTRAEVKQRIQQNFGPMRENLIGKALSFDERWEGDTLYFDASMMGQSVAGEVEVMDSAVRIEVRLPWLLAAAAEKIQNRLQKSGTLLLEKK